MLYRTMGLLIAVLILGAAPAYAQAPAITVEAVVDADGPAVDVHMVATPPATLVITEAPGVHVAAIVESGAPVLAPCTRDGLEITCAYIATGAGRARLYLDVTGRATLTVAITSGGQTAEDSITLAVAPQQARPAVYLPAVLR